MQEFAGMSSDEIFDMFNLDAPQPERIEAPRPKPKMIGPRLEYTHKCRALDHEEIHEIARMVHIDDELDLWFAAYNGTSHMAMHITTVVVEKSAPGRIKILVPMDVEGTKTTPFTFPNGEYELLKVTSTKDDKSWGAAPNEVQSKRGVKRAADEDGQPRREPSAEVRTAMDIQGVLHAAASGTTTVLAFPPADDAQGIVDLLAYYENKVKGMPEAERLLNPWAWIFSNMKTWSKEKLHTNFRDKKAQWTNKRLQSTWTRQEEKTQDENWEALEADWWTIHAWMETYGTALKEKTIEDEPLFRLYNSIRGAMKRSDAMYRLEVVMQHETPSYRFHAGEIFDKLLSRFREEEVTTKNKYLKRERLLHDAEGQRRARREAAMAKDASHNTQNTHWGRGPTSRRWSPPAGQSKRARSRDSNKKR